MGITVLNGLMLASTLALVALGLAIIFGLLRIINLAHGELFIVGGYTVFAVQAATGNPWLGILLAPVVVGALGMLLDRGMLRHLYERPLDTLVVTWGLSIVLREVLKLVFGPATLNVPSPIPGQVAVFGVAYPAYRLFLIVTCIAVLAVVLGVAGYQGWTVYEQRQREALRAAQRRKHAVHRRPRVRGRPPIDVERPAVR
jgi:urea transport system permease protein